MNLARALHSSVWWMTIRKDPGNGAQTQWFLFSYFQPSAWIYRLGLMANNAPDNSTVQIPIGYNAIEAILVGGGGAGASTAGSDNNSGGGGGGGALLHGIWRIPAQSTIGITVGNGGSAVNDPHPSILSLGGTTLGSAGCGTTATFVLSQISRGGAGGIPLQTTTPDMLCEVAYGADGSDGQFGSLIFAGNGAPGPRSGGGGRAAYSGRDPAAGLNKTPLDAGGVGGGGGGAYKLSTDSPGGGGNGGPGWVAVRFVKI